MAESNPKVAVFQATKFDRLRTLITLNLPARVENGTTMDAVYAEVQPNAAGQYVLMPTALMYERQLLALRRYAKKYNLKEIAKDKMGADQRIIEAKKAVAKDGDAAMAENSELKSIVAEQAKAMEKLNAQVAELVEASTKDDDASEADKGDGKGDKNEENKDDKK